MSFFAKSSPLFALGRMYVSGVTRGLSSYCAEAVDALLAAVIDGSIDCATASAHCTELIGTSDPIIRLMRILTVSEIPLPSRLSLGDSLSRKKTACWTEKEDLRLLAAIHRYGLNAWGSVARFVGNSRQRSQCAQRWARGLDPRILKMQWNAEEDNKLCTFVAQFGEKAWKRIAAELGNRSDVQCRYRYRQLQAEGQIPSPRAEPVPVVTMLLPSIHSLLALSNPALFNYPSPHVPNSGCEWDRMMPAVLARA
jgi:hypothetical protein